MDAERAGGLPDASVSGLARDRLRFFATVSLGMLRQPQVRPA
jgi:hypothetical protein